MSKKLILIGILIVSLSATYVNSLQCYECNTPNGCKNPSTVTCSETTANQTSEHLRVHHQVVPNISGSLLYDCLRLIYTYPQNNTVAAQIQGCIHPQVFAFGLTLKTEYSSQNWTRNSYTCRENKCNRNPAGTHSKSIFTILSAILTITIAKLVSDM